MAANYEQLVDYFIRNVPYGDAEPFSPQFNDLYNRWWGRVAEAQGAPNFEAVDLNTIPSSAITSFATELNSGDGASVPLEQDLLNTVVSRGSADVERDALRRTEADNLFTSLQPAYENNRRLIGDMSSGALLGQEQQQLGVSTDARLANLAEQMGIVRQSNGTYTAEQLANLDAFRTGIAGNIDTEVGALQTGLNPVLAARLNAAGAQEAAINLASQDARDQAVSQDALKGFVGGSSTLDQSLARASTGARQQAAGVRGDALLSNATDQYGLDRYGANQRRTLGDTFTTGGRTINDAAAQTKNLLDQYGAAEGRMVKDAGATGNFTLFENDINRRIGGLGLPTQYANDYLGARTAGDNYSNSGINRYLDQLNWFATNGTPPSSNPTTTTATDNGLATLGTGVAGVGLELMKNPAWANLFKGSNNRTGVMSGNMTDGYSVQY